MKTPAPQSALYATILLILGRIPSRFLGLIREVLSASLFGAGRAMDCFNLSFTVVTGLRQLFAEQFHTPVIPTYFKQRKQYGEEAALRSLSIISTQLNILALIVSVVLFIWAEPVVRLIAPGFDAEQVDLSTTMLRWFAVGGLGIILYRYYIALHTCFFRYTVVAFSPLLFNLGAIAGMVFLTVKMGVISLAAGMSAGFMAYLLVLIIYLPRRAEIMRPSSGRQDAGVANYYLLLLPLFLGVFMEQVQLFIDRALASHLPEGALSAQGYALRLVRMFSDFLIGTFGTVIFPIFSSLAQADKQEEFAKNFSLTLQVAIIVLSSVGTILIALALPIIHVLLERGSFTHSDSVLTSELLVIYTIAFAAHTLFVVINRGFHAHSNTKIPVITTIISMIVMIIFDFILIKPYGVHGLAIAMTIGYSLNMVLVYAFFTRHIPARVTFDNVKILFLSVVLGVILGWGMHYGWQFVQLNELAESLWTKITWITIFSSVTLLIYFLVLRLLKVSALEYITQKMQARRNGPPPEVAD